ncbi:hypothetical protein AB0C87_25225 [Actinomadura sp. NPDC048021]|uniref:hypothetical protein n=1 Tax=Actinomadura sp. NPDC048021 TaxID=3155385 RepID=UPI0033D05F34
MYQEYLGLKPYVLIEIDQIHADDSVEFRIRAGGGLDHPDIRDVLLVVLESLPEEEN